MDSNDSFNSNDAGDVFGNSFYNSDLDLSDDNDGIIPGLFDTDSFTPDASQGAANGGAAEPANAGAGNGAPDGTGNAGTADDDIDFSKIDLNDTGDNETEEDKAIAALAAKGYKVERPEDESIEKQFEDQLSIVDGTIQKINDFLSLNDIETCENRIKADKSALYRNTGREHLINQDEFNMEVEAEMASFQDDKYRAQMYANTIRDEVKNGILKTKTEEKAGITEQIKAKYNEKIQTSQKALEDSFRAIRTEGILGFTPSKEQIENAYKSISSGAFAREVKNNPRVLAETVLIHQNKALIAAGKNGGQTYGEGVRDAANKFVGNQDASRSSLGQAMAGASNASSQQSDFVSSWAETPAIEKDTKVFGRPQH